MTGWTQTPQDLAEMDRLLAAMDTDPGRPVRDAITKALLERETARLAAGTR